MSTEKSTYSLIVADLEAKRAAIDAALASLQKVMSLGAFGADDLPHSSALPQTATGIPEIPVGAFLHKRIPEAAKLYLSLVKKKQTTREIADALKAGGIESTSQDFAVTVGSVLNRISKSGKDVLHLSDGWGLASWYPAGFRNSIQGKSGKRGSPKSESKSAEANEPAPLSEEIPPQLQEKQRKYAGETNKTRITDFFKTRAGEVWQVADAGRELGLSKAVAHARFGELVRQGVLERMGQGAYRFASNGHSKEQIQ